MKDVFSSLNQQLSSLVVDGQFQPARLLNKPLNVRIMSIDVTGKFYGQNGFRFAGASACADTNTLERSVQRVRHLEKLKAGASDRTAIRLGYDSHLDIRDVDSCVSRLSDPRWRILCEVFWPHLSAETFDLVKKEGCLTSPAVLERLQRPPGNGDNPLLIEHARAIVYHNLALTGEIEHMMRQRDEWPQEYWTQSLQSWARTLKESRFWDYLKDRAAQLDDPRFKPEDVNDDFRQGIASIVLGFNAMFATTYARMGDFETYGRHHELITSSKLTSPGMDACLVTILKALTRHQLEPLVERARNPKGKPYYESDAVVPRASSGVSSDFACPRCNYCFGWDGSTCTYCGFSVAVGKLRRMLKAKKAQKFPTTDKVGWRCFAGFYDPIIAEAETIRHFLDNQLNMRKDLTQLAEFDALCGAILSALSASGYIDYSQEMEAGILHTLITAKRLLDWPLSASMRRQVSQAMQNDARSLYGEIDIPAGLDLTECWFLGGEPANPDSSILMPVHRILSETLTSVQYRTKYILIPRSKVAKARHEGTIKDSEVSEKRLAGRTDAQRKIQEIVDQKRQRQDDIQKRCETNVQETESERDRRVKKSKAEAGRQAQIDLSFIEQEKAKQETKRAEIEARHKAALKKVEKQFAAKLEERKELYEWVESQNTGWHRFVSLDIPFVLVGTVLCVCLWVVLMQVISTNVHLLFPLLIVAILGGTGIANIISRKRLGGARKGLDKVTSQRQEMTQKAEQVRDKDLARAESTYQQKTQEARQRFKKVEVKCQKILSEAETKAKRLKKEAEAQIKKIEEEIAALFRRLDNHVKPESDKRKYSIYKNAKSSGYHDGKEPPANRANAKMDRLLNSLTDEHKALLGMLQQRLSNDDFMKVLEMIVDEPSYKRRAILRGFLGM